GGHPRVRLADGLCATRWRTLGHPGQDQQNGRLLRPCGPKRLNQFREADAQGTPRDSDCAWRRRRQACTAAEVQGAAAGGERRDSPLIIRLTTPGRVSLSKRSLVSVRLYVPVFCICLNLNGFSGFCKNVPIRQVLVSLSNFAGSFGGKL